MKKLTCVVGLALGCGSAASADQTLTSELIKVGPEDVLVCDAVNVGQRAVDATVAIILVPPVGSPIDPAISATGAIKRMNLRFSLANSATGSVHASDIT